MALQKRDEELDTLEEEIRKLKSRYDQFFTGIQKMPPLTDRRRVESMIHELNKQKMRENSRRFRFNTLSALPRALASCGPTTRGAG